MSQYCVIVGCTNRARENCKTCALDDHQKIEDYRNAQQKSMFHLKQRLENLRTSSSTDQENDHDITVSLDSEGNMTAQTSEEDISCSDKPSTGNQSIKGRFGRVRIHNEELAVASCGTILGRASMHSSEAPNGVRVSLTSDNTGYSFKTHKSGIDILDESFSHSAITSRSNLV